MMYNSLDSKMRSYIFHEYAALKFSKSIEISMNVAHLLGVSFELRLHGQSSIMNVVFTFLFILIWWENRTDIFSHHVQRKSIGGSVFTCKFSVLSESTTTWVK